MLLLTHTKNAWRALESCTRIAMYLCSTFSARRELFCYTLPDRKHMSFLLALRSHLLPRDLNVNLQGRKRTPVWSGTFHDLSIPPGPSYLAFAGCTGRSHHCPYSTTKPCDPIAIWTGFPDVVGDVVSQTGVTDTVGTALSIRDSRVLAAQRRALERPTIHLSFL